MKYIILLSCFILPSVLMGQQISDESYHPAVLKPAYAGGNGPVVFIDEGHNNFHTKNGRYKAFADLLETDGYNVKGYLGLFETGEISKGKILVISNALNEINVKNWYLPTPSAFSSNEIEVVRNWVNDGGSLFLIADHMPMAGAATELARAFEFEFSNGFVFTSEKNGTAFFNMADGTLNESIITTGNFVNEKVVTVATFTGQGFKIPNDAIPILTFNGDYYNFLPDTAWVFNDNTPKFSAKGLSQGAYRSFGKGRVVVFGEAAMFTAQLVGAKKQKVGMNQAEAKENYQLLLNIIHWLDWKL